MIQGSGRCHYHPDRSGLGICVECRRVICTECTTQFEGINRCANCLEQKLATVRQVAERKEWSAGNIFLSLLAIGSVFGLVYLIASWVS